MEPLRCRFDKPEVALRHGFGSGRFELNEKIDVTVTRVFVPGNGAKNAKALDLETLAQIA